MVLASSDGVCVRTLEGVEKIVLECLEFELWSTMYTQHSICTVIILLYTRGINGGELERVLDSMIQRVISILHSGVFSLLLLVDIFEALQIHVVEQ